MRSGPFRPTAEGPALPGGGGRHGRRKAGRVRPGYWHVRGKPEAFPPPEDLLKLAGEWVAFSADGTRILAHGKEFEEVKAAMEAAGLNPFDAVWDQLPPLDVDSML